MLIIHTMQILQTSVGTSGSLWNMCSQYAGEKSLNMEATLEEALEEIMEEAPVVDLVEVRGE